MKKAGITDQGLLQKAEQSADAAIPQIQDFAGSVDAVKKFKASPASSDPGAVATARAGIVKEMTAKGQELIAAQGKALKDLGVDFRTAGKIEAITAIVIENESSMIVAKGAKAPGR